MSTSSEFISLCRSQIALLTQGLGAALSVVYLTERLIESGTTQDKLIPVVAYPETAGVWEGWLTTGALLPATAESGGDFAEKSGCGSACLEKLGESRGNPDSLRAPTFRSPDIFQDTAGDTPADPQLSKTAESGAGAVSHPQGRHAQRVKTKDKDIPQLKKTRSQKASIPEILLNAENGIPDCSNHSLTPSKQIVLPLMHDGVLMGLLVTSREDRAWNEHERHEIERVAQTLTFARLLDRRREWLEQKLTKQRRFSQQQRDLLDNLLHQFRNPLTALRTFGKLLLKRLLPGDANRAIADSILRESDRLTQLLQQFDRAIDLTLEAESGGDFAEKSGCGSACLEKLGESRGNPDSLRAPTFRSPDIFQDTAGVSPADSQLFKTDDEIKSLPASPVMEATVEPVPQLTLLASTTTNLCLIADVLKPLLASAAAIAEERNLDLLTDIPPNLPPVKADANQLREVLSNLIDNALKYTPAKGKIYVQAGLKQDNLQGIAISDTGEGIPPQDLEHLFERHYRGVKADSEIPGTGLGLAIAKDLIEQMQGKIEVFSPAIWHPDSATGSGTTVIVWLRLVAGG